MQFSLTNRFVTFATKLQKGSMLNATRSICICRDWYSTKVLTLVAKKQKRRRWKTNRTRFNKFALNWCNILTCMKFCHSTHVNVNSCSIPVCPLGCAVHAKWSTAQHLGHTIHKQVFNLCTLLCTGQWWHIRMLQLSVFNLVAQHENFLFRVLWLLTDFNVFDRWKLITFKLNAAPFIFLLQWMLRRILVTHFLFEL